MREPCANSTTIASRRATLLEAVNEKTSQERALVTFLEAARGTRTLDLRFTKASLYQLSYGGKCLLQFSHGCHRRDGSVVTQNAR